VAAGGPWIDPAGDNHDNSRLVFLTIWEINLANSLSARKRARQAEKHRLRNASQRSLVRTHIRKVMAAIEAGDRDAAEAAYRQAVPAIDRSVHRGLMHRNKAARHKSRLNARIRAL
jgi:small subunit ribosomal protein S20